MYKGLSPNFYKNFSEFQQVNSLRFAKQSSRFSKDFYYFYANTELSQRKLRTSRSEN